MAEQVHELEPHELEALDILLKVLEAFCVIAVDRMQEAGEQAPLIEQDPRIARRKIG